MNGYLQTDLWMRMSIFLSRRLARSFWSEQFPRSQLEVRERTERIKVPQQQERCSGGGVGVAGGGVGRW